MKKLLHIIILFLSIAILHGCAKKKEQNTEIPSADTVKTATVAADTAEKKFDYEKSSILEIVEHEFDLFLEKRIPELEKEVLLKNYKKENYQKVYKNRMSRAESLLQGDSGAIAYVKRYQESFTTDSVDAIVDTIRKYVKADSTNTAMYIIDSASIRFDSNGVVTSGILLCNDSGKTGLKPIVPVDGSILIISPQVLYAFPGNKNSAIGVINPKDGPWKVCASFTNTNIRTTMDREKHTIGKEIFHKQRFSYSLKSFYLVKNNKIALGWIDADSAAFWGSDHDLSFFSKGVYTSGIPFFIQGAWEYTQVNENVVIDEGDIPYTDTSGNTLFYDFLHLGIFNDHYHNLDVITLIAMDSIVFNEQYDGGDESPCLKISSYDELPKDYVYNRINNDVFIGLGKKNKIVAFYYDSETIPVFER